MKPEPSNMKVEDEEDLLYGESGSSFKMNNVSISIVNIPLNKNLLNYNLDFSWQIWQCHQILRNPTGGDDSFNRKNHHSGYLLFVTMAIWRFILCLT